MLEFHKVLFPVDFSSRCAQSAPYVASIARKFQSEVVLLHVFNIGGVHYGHASPAVAYAACEDVIRQHYEDALESFGRSEFDGLEITRTVEAGDPAATIVRYADEHRIDLIVMPSHGEGRFRQLLLGSVTAKVLHDAERPVWTTAHSEALSPCGAEQIRQIVCALDSSPHAASVLCAASEIADRYGADVTLVHAIPTPELAPVEGIEEAPFRRFLFDTAKGWIADLQRANHTNFGVCILSGNVATVVRERALSCGAQLTIIGRGRITEFLGRLRSNVSAIIRESPCPVLSV